MNDEKKTIVIVGGGIAGLSCVEALFEESDNLKSHVGTVVLISESRLVKRIANYELSGRNLERFNVIEGDIDEMFSSRIPTDLMFKPIIGTVTIINHSEQNLIYQEYSGDILREHILSYDVLCLCNGSKPKQLTVIEEKNLAEIYNRMIIIKDTSTVDEFKSKLIGTKRLVVIGNGGISLELISEITNCEKIWIVRDGSIGLTFFDSGAEKFLLDSFAQTGQTTLTGETDNRASSVITSLNNSKQKNFGPALGPNWLCNTKLIGACPDDAKGLDIVYRDEVVDVTYDEAQDHALCVSTQNGRSIRCDLIAVAIGVVPNKLEITGHQLETSDSDGGILIDDQMQTSVKGIYAAGDVVSCAKWPTSDTWFQMRLWTQARQMGFYAGRCIANHIIGQEPSIYFNFDCFTHCTQFFGYKVILLGMYNGQTITDDDSDCEVIARVNPGKDYVKIIIKNNRIVGAVLIGDSGLEETIENLIHDKLDISEVKDHLLDGTVEIEDYFD